MTCQEVADKLLVRLKASHRGKRHQYETERRLLRFNSDYGDWLACDVSTEVVDDFLTGLDLAPRTKENYRLAVYRLFSHAVLIKAATSNPVADAMRLTIKPTETGVLSPSEVATLLSVADNDTLPGLAISFFAGVRRAEIERLDWSEIDFDEGHIEIKAGKSKTAQRRLIPITDNLKKWLLPYAQHEGGVIRTPAIWRKGIEKARDDAKIKEWPHNAGRHSYASYHLAHHKDAGSLATSLGHPNPTMLYKHYRALVSVKAAATYWSIKPVPVEADNVTNINAS